MSKQYPGGFITKSPTTPTTLAAPGIWTLDQAMQNIKAGSWPNTSVYAATNLYTAPVSGVGFSTYTFSGVNLGVTGTTKVVAVVFDGAGVATTISSATIGGVSATINQTLYSSSWGQVAILTATGVSATTGNIVLNFASALNVYGAGYLASISASVYATSRTNIDAYQSSYTSTNPTVTANGNNRFSGLTIVSYYSTNSSTSPPPALNANANLITDYSQAVAYSTGGVLDRHSAYNGITSTSFSVVGGSASYTSLGCITLY